MFFILADLNWEYPANCTEDETKVLLEVKVSTDGTVELSPPISLGGDLSTTTGSRPKGIFKFYDRHGGQYECTIALHGQGSAPEQQALRKDALWQQHERAHNQRLRQLQRGAFHQPRSTRFILHGDITSAAGFEHDRLYIEFSLRFPKAVWRLRGPSWLLHRHKELRGAFETEDTAHVRPVPT